MHMQMVKTGYMTINSPHPPFNHFGSIRFDSMQCFQLSRNVQAKL